MIYFKLIEIQVDPAEILENMSGSTHQAYTSNVSKALINIEIIITRDYRIKWLC